MFFVLLPAALLLSAEVASHSSGFCSLFTIRNYSHIFQNSFIVILFIVELLRGSEYIRRFHFPGFHPVLFTFYPSGVKNASHRSLNPTHIFLKNFYNTIKDLWPKSPFRGQGFYFFNSNKTAAVIIIFTNANGINFFHPRFINWS